MLHLKMKKGEKATYLIKVLPEVLGHNSEGTQIGGNEGVETGVSVVRVGTVPSYSTISGSEMHR